jgi:hypothetical protein
MAAVHCHAYAHFVLTVACMQGASVAWLQTREEHDGQRYDCDMDVVGGKCVECMRDIV